MRVYLCDDNASHRFLYREVLSMDRGLELVGACADPRAAVDELRALAPEVVLLDVSMPGFDGFAALPLLRATVPDATIIMFSTAWSEANEARALSLGASAYVQKPRDIDDLPALIRGAAGDAGALVQHLVERWLTGDIDRALAALHHDIEVVTLSLDPMHGIEELRRRAGRLPPGIKDAVVRPVGLLEHEGRVVLFTTAEVTREGDVVEHLTPAYVMTARHGKLAHIKAYPTWDDARTAAGAGSGSSAPRLRRLTGAGRWMLAVTSRGARLALG